MSRPGRLPAGRTWLSVALFLASSLSLAAEEPSLELDPEGRLVLHSLPPVLGDDEVRPQLTKGLTATFLFRVEPEGRRLRKKAARLTGGARIEIRYELWDEVFHVVTGTADGRLERRTLDSLGELESWWKSLKLVVLGSDVLPRDPGPRRRAPPHTAPRTAKVSLDVVPFSQAEQRDTQRWFSETLDDASRSGAEEVAESADRPPSTLDRTFHLLMATSIQRQALASWRWTVPIDGST